MPDVMRDIMPHGVRHLHDRRGRLITGVCEQNTPPRKKTLRNVRFHSPNSAGRMGVAAAGPRPIPATGSTWAPRARSSRPPGPATGSTWAPFRMGILAITSPTINSKNDNNKKLISKQHLDFTPLARFVLNNKQCYLCLKS